MSNIDAFKSDLDLLKNRRSIIQAKLDEANNRVNELLATLKSLGYSSIDEAKAAYAKQLRDVETQHGIVKSLIEEIEQVDSKIPTKESVIEKLNALSNGEYVKAPEQATTQVSAPQVETVAPIQQVATQVNLEPQTPVVNTPVNTTETPAQAGGNVTSGTNPTNINELDLGGLLFANL